ncbi:MAG: primosomal protein N' [Spirochaetota bacterium]|nr:MAG: primosomal protein N' [Spirochaetota bacterium]
MFASVVFNRPIEPLIYKLPVNDSSIRPGMRVRVPLRGSSVTGMIYKMLNNCDLKEVKPVEEVLDDIPIMDNELIELGEWMAQYYLCSIGEALWTIIPGGFIGKRIESASHIQCLAEETKKIVLTHEQRAVYDSLKGALADGRSEEFLLYGITGSGKTEVYLRIIDDVVKSGGGAILLVPEISLTPQTVNYFARRVGDELAILHSRLTKTERISEWINILTGQKRIVIGARSAVFAPLNNIGVIIIDEEHETSYKSEETPRYSAKRVALFRVKKNGAILVLGSATPSIESYHLAKLGRFKLLQLKNRVSNQSLPKTYVTDLKKTKSTEHISKTLIKEIEGRLQKREQVILFLNRRGFSPYIYCTNCGHVFKCRNCDITLTYHRKDRKLNCHYCDYSEIPPDVCPNCGSERIGYSGFGTEKVEKYLSNRFPAAVVVRMDTDTVRKRHALPDILKRFSKKEIDILIGTQIVTKGLHFPDVTLVGVLNADIPLNFPDFRSAERTFNIITQVSGRSGRSDKGGDVIIQTYNPVHYAIQTAKNQDYEEFYAREIHYRQALFYPPFCRIIRLVFRGEDSDYLFSHAQKAASFIREKNCEGITILGPTFCPISRIKRNHRIHIIIKLKELGDIRPVLRELERMMKPARGLYMEIDIDPLSML